MSLASRRISKDLLEIAKSPETGSCEPVDEDLRHLVARFPGPDGSPYAQGTFTLDIRMPSNYPFGPPAVAFKQCVTRNERRGKKHIVTHSFVYHPNVEAVSGRICVDILNIDRWRPAQTLWSVLHSIRSLLADPNPDSPLEYTVAKQFMDDPAGFERCAQEFTRTCATGNVDHDLANSHRAGAVLTKFVAMGFSHDAVMSVLRDVHDQGAYAHEQVHQRLLLTD